MRPIDADKLIELIKNNKIDLKSMKIMEAIGCELQAQTLNLACNYLIAMIKEQPICAEYGQWIPCSDRLPMSDDWVFVTILDEYGDTPFRYADFGWYLEAANCWIVDAEQRTDVVAWMPKPKPWNGEKDEHNT